MKQRVAVIKHKNSYVYCREMIGGAYYTPIARFADKDQVKTFIKGPQDEQIIIYFSPGNWAVTSKDSDGDLVKSILCECSTRIAAESMIR